jgi:hypothetical protein
MRIFLENAFMLSYVVVVILSIVKYAKYFDTPLKYLPIIFFYTLLTELLGGFILVNEEWRFFGVLSVPTTPAIEVIRKRVAG